MTITATFIPVTSFAHSDTTGRTAADHHATPDAADLVNDLTPQLGGDLDGNGSDITGIGHIGFLAAQDASAGANDFDDYEEGTWTPTIQDQSLSDAEAQTYTSQSGSYTKKGREVTVHCVLHINSLGTLTVGEVAAIGGLPFTSNAAAVEMSAICAQGDSLAIAAGTTVSGVIGANVTNINLRLWDVVTGTSNLLISEVSAGGIFRFSATYEV